MPRRVPAGDFSYISAKGDFTGQQWLSSSTGHFPWLCKLEEIGSSDLPGVCCRGRRVERQGHQR